jgi:hypothetical protein
MEAEQSGNVTAVTAAALIWGWGQTFMELLGILLIGFFSWASWNMFEFYTWFKFSSFFLALDTHIFFFLYSWRISGSLICHFSKLEVLDS